MEARTISEDSYYRIHGEMPFTTYHNMVELGKTGEYYLQYLMECETPKEAGENIAQLLCDLVMWLKAHDKMDYITELQELDIENDYKVFVSMYHNL